MVGIFLVDGEVSPVVVVVVVVDFSYFIFKYKFTDDELYMHLCDVKNV